MKSKVVLLNYLIIPLFNPFLNPRSELFLNDSVYNVNHVLPGDFMHVSCIGKIVRNFGMILSELKYFADWKRIVLGQPHHLYSIRLDVYIGG